jgi:hypothetical protein
VQAVSKPQAMHSGLDVAARPLTLLRRAGRLSLHDSRVWPATWPGFRHFPEGAIPTKCARELFAPAARSLTAAEGLDALALVAEAKGPPAAVPTVGLARRRRPQAASYELDALALVLEAVVLPAASWESTPSSNVKGWGRWRAGPIGWASRSIDSCERELARFRLHLVRHRTTQKNRIHATLMTFGHPCPVSDLFGHAGRELPDRLAVPDPWRRNVDARLELIDDLELQIASLTVELKRQGADHR